MINCQELSFSSYYSEKRFAIASKIIGTKLVNKIIAFALYLLGASRKAIAGGLDLPYDTIKSFTDRMEQNGISALVERRLKQKKIAEIKPSEIKKVEVDSTSDFLVLSFGNENQQLQIPANNTIQIRTVILTMLENGLIDINTASKILDCHPAHIQRLNRQLQKDDATIFIDMRQGQRQDYVFNSDTKAEMIQQYIANLVNRQKISSQALSEDLKQRCDLNLSPRTIRLHIKKLGLSKIKKSLPELIDCLKKTQKTDRW